MLPELGHLALILALQLALLQGAFGFYGATPGMGRWLGAARGAAAGQCLFVALGFGALGWAFYANDFSVLNVAEHSSRHLPAVYRLTASWGSHEGSMLLWALILAGWSLVVAWVCRGPADTLSSVSSTSSRGGVGMARRAQDC